MVICWIVSAHLAINKRADGIVLTEITRLRNGGDKLAYLFVGVDDSTPGNTIQTNEISYIRSLLGEQATLYAEVRKMQEEKKAAAAEKNGAQRPSISIVYDYGDEDRKPDAPGTV